MRNSTGKLALMVSGFSFGVITLVHYSQNVRIIDFMGLTAGGAACGAALAGVIAVLKRGTRPTTGDKSEPKTK